MFLTYLSNFDYEEPYWAFVLRFETLAHGVIVAASPQSPGISDSDIYSYLRDLFTKTLDKGSGVVPSDWWNNIEIPSADWLERYLNRELPFMVKQLKRLSDKTDAHNSKPNDQYFYREKIKRLAHGSLEFQRYLLNQ